MGWTLLVAVVGDELLNDIFILERILSSSLPSVDHAVETQ
jgi:hypothetical protein